ncbi:aminotransferase class I/II-fold pyridoxal phosphate-dependent enzyme [Rothia halotolerans]|uniref:aminotransferase class I/II-fold pyridoxal phosphate-dependent enzyme n=1 Tax=Rothia halotolerans TaxID=405770 RepID=UPI00101DD90B|nr:aminotransferase class I/II-fold pyridoxal phosphate-dependent enzyme [Rothia halotolerans]
MPQNSSAPRIPLSASSLAAPPRAPWEACARGAGLLGPEGGLSSTIFEEMSALASAHGAINLGQGFPDTDGPAVLAESLGAAVAEGRNQYATIVGDAALREEISLHESLAGRRAPDPGTEVTVTAGATEGLTAAMLSFLSPGDEVVVFEPSYDLYPAIAALAGADVVAVPMLPPAFGVDPERLREAFSPRTRMVVVNDPHNPTGTVLGEELLRQVALLAEEFDALILTDSVYEHLVFEGAPVDLASLPGAQGRTIWISSASKTFSVTGWRVGWVIAPEELSRGVRVTKGYLSHSAAAPLQAAVAATMRWARTEGFYAEWLAGYRRQRRILLDGLAGTCLSPVVPAGTFFAVARLDAEAVDWAHDGESLARALPERAGVAVVPLTAFAGAERRDPYRDWVRLAFCKRPEVLRAAGERIAAAGRTVR